MHAEVRDKVEPNSKIEADAHQAIQGEIWSYVKTFYK